MKKKASLVLNLFSMFCYGLCGAVWLHKAFSGGTWFDALVGLVWLAGAVIWTVRAVREAGQKPEEPAKER